MPRWAEDDRDAPAVAVIIAAHDAAATIGEQLSALSNQTGAPPFTVIVVDDGSSDRTCDRVRGHMVSDDRVTLVESTSRRGPNHARNRGAQIAAGSDVLLFCDADDVAAPDWVAGMVDALIDADIVAGPLDDEALNDPEVRSWYVGPGDGLIRRFGYLPYGSGAALGVRRDLFEAIGGWDESFVNATDADLWYRAQLDGKARVGIAAAVMHYRYRPTRSVMRRQMRNYGRGTIRLWRRYRNRGMIYHPWIEASRSAIWLLRHLPDIGRSGRAGTWHRRLARTIGMFTGLVADHPALSSTISTARPGRSRTGA